MPSIGYAVYIDESGDDGIRRVQPIDMPGASEWFVLAAFVVEIHNDAKVQRWLLEGIQKLNSPQRQDLHFARLDDGRRVTICHHVASLPARCFVAISNKQNMRGYRNVRAERAGSKNFFYNFMARILLEKVTRYCYQHSMKRHHEPRRLRIEFSTRGGMFYPHTKDYLAKIYLQSKNGTLFNSVDDLAWDVIDIQNIHHFDHKNRAGLQFADIVAGGFYQGLEEKTGRTGDMRFATILRPLLALNSDGTPWGVGLKFMPNYLQANLTDEQRILFEIFGAPQKSGRPPDPHSTIR